MTRSLIPHPGRSLLFTKADRTRVAVMVALGLAVVLLSPREPVPMLGQADVPVAAATAALVRAAGLDVERQGPVLRHPGGFAMEVYWRCTGLIPAAFLASVVFTCPSPLAWRLVGALVGGCFILLLNLSRLSSLFAVGAFRPRSFAWAHDLGELSIVLSVPFAWLLWLGLGRRRAATMAG
jgi:exosortase/archaeosortase family protein